MKVLFEIKLDGRTAVSESQLSNEFETYRERLVTLEDPEGGVLVYGDNDQAELSVGDDLIALVDQLCVKAVSALLEGESYRFNLFAYPEHIELSPEGGRISITGSDIAPCDLARAELLPALTDCGERFVKAMTKIRNAVAGEGLLGKMQRALTDNRAKLEAGV